MKRVTRNIIPASARDLLERVPRVCLSFACDQGPQVQPVAFLWHGGRYLAGIPQRVGRKPEPDQEVVVLIDEGIYFFDLRAIYIRGRVIPVEVPDDKFAHYTWFEVIPLKVVAWDYGTLREVSDET